MELWFFSWDPNSTNGILCCVRGASRLPVTFKGFLLLGGLPILTHTCSLRCCSVRSAYTSLPLIHAALNSGYRDGSSPIKLSASSHLFLFSFFFFSLRLFSLWTISGAEENCEGASISNRISDRAITVKWSIPIRHPAWELITSMIVYVFNCLGKTNFSPGSIWKEGEHWNVQTWNITPTGGYSMVRRNFAKHAKRWRNPQHSKADKKQEARERWSQQHW